MQKMLAVAMLCLQNKICTHNHVGWDRLEVTSDSLPKNYASQCLVECFFFFSFLESKQKVLPPKIQSIREETKQKKKEKLLQEQFLKRHKE